MHQKKMTDQEQIECPEDSRQIDRLRAIMHRLRAPGGCPWDAEQTHQSLVGNLIEESYEAIDAIRRGDMPHLREELGDVLLQVVFHSEIASESGHFSFDDVAREVSEKLVRRHPHVYAESKVNNTDGVLTQWDEIKRQEKGGKVDQAYLDGVGEGLPAILKAAKIQKKVSKVGFDWPSAISITDKVEEELEEVREELERHSDGAEPTEHLKNEVGDLLFVVVNLARKLNLNPEEMIDRTNQKFVRRFNQVERSLESQGLELSSEHQEAMERAWTEAKISE